MTVAEIRHEDTELLKDQLADINRRQLKGLLTAARNNKALPANRVSRSIETETPGKLRGNVFDRAEIEYLFRVAELTRPEREILMMHASDYTLAEIAERLATKYGIHGANGPFWERAIRYQIERLLQILRYVAEYGERPDIRRAHYDHERSLFLGVSRTGRKWQATIVRNRKRHYLGVFESELEAARAYKQAANRLGWTDTATSKHKGVSWCSAEGKYRATIIRNGTERHLGFFEDEDEAAEAYRQAETYFEETGQLPPKPKARGISYVAASDKWRTYVWHDGQQLHYGYYDSEFEARDVHRKVLDYYAEHGEYPPRNAV